MLEPKDKRSVEPSEARLQYLLHLIKKKRRCDRSVRAMIRTYYGGLTSTGKQGITEELKKERPGLSLNMEKWLADPDGSKSGGQKKRGIIPNATAVQPARVYA